MNGQRPAPASGRQPAGLTKRPHGLGCFLRICTSQVNLGKRGQLIALVEITSTGWDMLRTFKVDTRKPEGKGSFIHQFWQDRIKEWYLNQDPECKAEIEKSVYGKAVDVSVETKDKKIAVEILIKGEEKELTNIAKDIETGWDEVIVCCESKYEINSLSRRVKEIYGNRCDGLVNFRQLKEFAV